MDGYVRFKRLLLPFIIAAVFFAAYLWSASRVESARQGRQNSFQFTGIDVSPVMARLLAGEFKGLMADYLLLNIQAFVGANQKVSDDEWQAVASTFEQVQALDPYFQQTYILGQGVLAFEADMPLRAIDILNSAREHRPWDWRPGYYTGFDYYYFLKDFEKASTAFLNAGKIKNSPEILAVLGARFANKSGRSEWALRLLAGILAERKQDGITENKELENRIKALQGVIALEQGVKSFKTLEGRLPYTFEELVGSGVVAHIPENPYGDKFFFDPDSGEILFDQVGVKKPIPAYDSQKGPEKDKKGWSPFLDSVE